LMTWLWDGETIHHRTGPVPDNRLQPIRRLRLPHCEPGVVAVEEKITA
jgi:hypothetical protein